MERTQLQLFAYTSLINALDDLFSPRRSPELATIVMLATSTVSISHSLCFHAGVALTDDVAQMHSGGKKL